VSASPKNSGRPVRQKYATQPSAHASPEVACDVMRAPALSPALDVDADDTVGGGGGGGGGSDDGSSASGGRYAGVPSRRESPWKDGFVVDNVADAVGGGGDAPLIITSPSAAVSSSMSMGTRDESVDTNGCRGCSGASDACFSLQSPLRRVLKRSLFSSNSATAEEEKGRHAPKSAWVM
jgi:hypothetical protein